MQTTTQCLAIRPQDLRIDDMLPNFGRDVVKQVLHKGASKVEVFFIGGGARTFDTKLRIRVIRSIPVEQEAGEVLTQNQAQPQIETSYRLPEGGGKALHNEWHMNQTRQFVPNPRQQLVMNAVGQALDDGLFYTEEVLAGVVTLLNIPESVCQIQTTNVENGDLGMDVYYARRAVEAQRQFKREDEDAKRLNLVVGDKLGVLVNNTLKRFNACKVTSVNGANYSILGSRGGQMYVITTTSSSVITQMDRAFEHGLRKTNAEAFIASRAIDSQLLPTQLIAPVQVPTDEHQLALI